MFMFRAADPSIRYRGGETGLQQTTSGDIVVYIEVRNVFPFTFQFPVIKFTLQVFGSCRGDAVLRKRIRGQLLNAIQKRKQFLLDPGMSIMVSRLQEAKQYGGNAVKIVFRPEHATALSAEQASVLQQWIRMCNGTHFLGGITGNTEERRRKNKTQQKSYKKCSGSY